MKISKKELKNFKMTNWFLENVWDKSQSGFFVEIGAYDGILMNSTKLLEDSGWDGVCFEAHPERFKKLVTNRKCKCYPYAVYNYDGEVTFNITNTPGWDGIAASHNHPDVELVQITVPCRSWYSLQLPATIDYLQLDVEGAELEILKTINHQLTTISYICLEDNDPENSEYSNYMKSIGYELVYQFHVDWLWKKII